MGTTHPSPCSQTLAQGELALMLLNKPKPVPAMAGAGSAPLGSSSLLPGSGEQSVAPAAPGTDKGGGVLLATKAEQHLWGCG